MESKDHMQRFVRSLLVGAVGLVVVVKNFPSINSYLATFIREHMREVSWNERKNLFLKQRNFNNPFPPTL